MKNWAKYILIKELLLIPILVGYKHFNSTVENEIKKKIKFQIIDNFIENKFYKIN